MVILYYLAYYLFISNFPFTDVISCTTFNPVYPVIASCSGQRKFSLPDNSSSEDEDTMDLDDQVIIDNTLKHWRVPGQYEWYPYEYDTSGVVATEAQIIEDATTVTEETIIATNLEEAT